MPNIVNLYHVPKLHGINFNEDAFLGAMSHIQKMDKQRDMLTYDRVVSCYRSPNNVYMSCGTTVRVADSSSPRLQPLCRLFFPLWILPALIPADNKVLHISKVTVAHFPGLSVEPYVNDGNLGLNGRLEITELNVLCINEENKDEVFKLTKNFMSKFDRSIKLDLDHKLNVTKDFESLITHVALDIKQESPHTMFGSCRGISHFFQPPSAEVCDSLVKGLACETSGSYGDRILIATLGYGYNDHPFHNNDASKIELLDSTTSFGQPGLRNQDEWLTHAWIIHEYTKYSSFFIAQTTDENGIIINGATALAIRWLRAKWHEFKRRFDNLIVLIPYGGQYMEEEMIEITKAADEGIIIVCAAGDCRESGGGDVVFPAALGTVISVGVAGTGPKGREVDVSVDFASRPATLPGVKSIVCLPEDCGIAAARITGLLSLLLARINKIICSSNTETPYPYHSIIKHIKENLDEEDDKDDENTKLHKKRKRYMHICVIRELLVNEGRGMHDPQLGYGDGEEIIISLLTMKESNLLQRLANVVIIDPDITRSTDNQNQDVICDPFSKSKRQALFFGLDGNKTTVAVIDKYICKKELKENVTTFGNLQSLHGDQCAAIVRAICPKSDILCVNTATKATTKAKDLYKAFHECRDESLETHQIDIISCSVCSPRFDYDLCKAVNEAVRAGKIIVYAAGNEGLSHSNTIAYPGRQGNILVVGGRDKNYSRIGFSSVGKEMDFLANADAKKFLKSIGSGTSYAAPIVAGYIALLLQFIKEKMTDDKIKVWSQKQWINVSVFNAARNVYAMRELLKLLVVKPQEHAETEGYGCLEFTTLFPHYNVPEDMAADAQELVRDEAKQKILKALQDFYKRDN